VPERRAFDLVGGRTLECPVIVDPLRVECSASQFADVGSRGAGEGSQEEGRSFSTLAFVRFLNKSSV
jgi:hypothetical protein